MSIAFSIFLAAVFLGVIYLYINTRGRWNWPRITKRALVILGVLIAIPYRHEFSASSAMRHGSDGHNL